MTINREDDPHPSGVDSWTLGAQVGVADGEDVQVAYPGVSPFPPLITHPPIKDSNSKLDNKNNAKSFFLLF